MPETIKNEGCPEKVKEALKKAVKLAEGVKAYRELGTPEEIRKVLENVNQFVEKYGPFEEVAKKLDELAQFEENVGTLERTMDFLERLLDAAMEEKAEEIAESYGIGFEKAKELLEEFESPAKVEALLAELTEAKATPEEKEEEVNEAAPEDAGEADEKNDEKNEAAKEKDEYDVIEDEELRRARLVIEEAKKPLDEEYLTKAVTRRLLDNL